MLKNFAKSQIWVTWEVDVGGSWFEASPGKNYDPGYAGGIDQIAV
jgi:hypothetical protein